jgi:membrane protein
MLAAVILATAARRQSPAPAQSRQGMPFPVDDKRGAGAGAVEQDWHAGAERGRGRLADRPAGIPSRGWKDILWRTYNDISEHRILAIAAGVTYYVLLAIFPALAALVSIYGFVADPGSITRHLDSLSAVVPGGALQILRDQITRLSEHAGSTLGLTVLIGLLISLWSAGSGVKALIDALNIVYEEKEKRSFVRLNLVALAFTLGTIGFMILALSATVVIPFLLNFVGLQQQTASLISLSRWPALLVLAAFGLAVIYRFAPSRTRPKWRWISYGSAFAAVVWLIGSVLFSWYASHFGNYDATYGTLGAAIGFLTWMWLSNVVILLGAQINAEIEHQTVHDTTEGPEKPMGARHATMADTVGEAQS